MSLLAPNFVEFQNIIILFSIIHNRFENLALSREDALLWRTPLLFAYVCSTRCEITLMVNSPPVVESGASDADPMIITSVDPVFNHEAFLVLNELQVG